MFILNDITLHYIMYLTHIQVVKTSMSLGSRFSLNHAWCGVFTNNKKPGRYIIYLHIVVYKVKKLENYRTNKKCSMSCRD